ncbi:MAG: hypothetical protein ABIQ52_21945 [Vicinamibacterales bacterium]
MTRALGATLAIGLLTLVSLAAQKTAAPPAANQATGPLPAEWKARLDDAAAKPDAVTVAAERESLTITTGPAGIFYKPGMKAEQDYDFTATFSQLQPSAAPQPYGLFIGGADLDKTVPRYTAFVIRSDGKYQITSRNGSRTVTVVGWRAAPQMADPKGVKTSNTLSIRGLRGAVHFLVGQREVHQMPRGKAGGDGIAGIRVGPNLKVQVNRLAVKKFP